MPGQQGLQFVLAGRINSDVTHDHGDAAIPGKTRVHVQTEGSCYVAHVPSPPSPGSWVGLTGEWLRVELGSSPLGVYVEYQIDATGWVSFPDGYDPTLDGDLQEWLADASRDTQIELAGGVDTSIPLRNTD